MKSVSRRSIADLVLNIMVLMALTALSDALMGLPR